MKFKEGDTVWVRLLLENAYTGRATYIRSKGDKSLIQAEQHLSIWVATDRLMTVDEWREHHKTRVR